MTLGFQKDTRDLFSFFVLHFLFYFQYATDVRTVQKRIQDIEDAIVFINKEEVLYKWDQTFYPELEVMKETIEPYQKLFNVVLKWQRTKKRFVKSSVLVQ